MNAAASGGALLTAGVVRRSAETSNLRSGVGKFKTPFSHAYLTTLGETLLPNHCLYRSLPPLSSPTHLNAVTPNIGTGFDLGSRDSRFGGRQVRV